MDDRKRTRRREWQWMKEWVETLEVRDLPERFHNSIRMVEDPKEYLKGLKIRTRKQKRIDKELVNEIRQVVKAYEFKLNQAK